MNSFLEDFPIAFVVLKVNEQNLTVEEVNRAFLGYIHLERVDMIAKPFFEVLKSKESGESKINLDKLSSVVQKAIGDKHIVETDILEFDQNLFNDADGKNLYLQFKCSPVIGEDGKTESVIIAVNDVTDLSTGREKIKPEAEGTKSRKELQIITDDLASQAAVNKAQYESASKELDDFVYSVAHDFRAPFRRIDGFSQELLNEYEDKFDETGAHYLKRIRQGAQDMGQLIDDLLKLSRISRKSVDIEDIDLGEITKSVFEELMELEPEREVELKIDEELKVEADKGLIKAMLSNLISNALKFTSKREVAEIQIGSKILDGKKVFYISDNGVGFDPSYSHKLFKAFSRLHSHNEFSGTGIGLATVKRIMTLHGGTIWAESPEGKGATFYFKF